MLYNENKSHCPPCPPRPPKKQTHVHEIQGSVEIAEIKKPYYSDDKKDPYYGEDRKDPYYYERKKDSYYDCDKEKKDHYYDCDKEKKDPYYDCDKEKKDHYYDCDKEKKDPYDDYEKPKKKPCYDYDEDKKDPYEEECKKDHHKRCPKEEGHNHRFAVVSGEAIPVGCKDHYHEVKFRTDFYEDHFHVFVGKTGGAIRVGDRHVHFLESQTSFNDGHRHDFRVATLIEDPIGD